MIIFTPNSVIKSADMNTNFAESINFTKMSNIYRFSVKGATGTQAIGAATEATIQYAVENYDTNNNFNTSTYQYTAPLDGYYHFTHTVRVDASQASTIQCKILIAGTSYKLASVDTPGANQVCLTGSIDVYMTAGQTCEGRAYNGNGTGTCWKEFDSRLSGYLVTVF